MNKKTFLFAAMLIMGAQGFAQKLSPSTSVLLQEVSTGKRKAKAANGADSTVNF